MAWTDRVVEYPNRIKLTQVDGQENTYNMEANEGTVYIEGTLLNADNLNNETMNLISGVVADVWNSSKSYNIGDICIYDNKLWNCLTANTNVPPTEGTYWTMVKIGEKVSRLDETIFSQDEISLKVNVERQALTAPDRNGIWYVADASGSMPSGLSHWGMLINLRSPYSLHPTSSNAVYAQIYIDVLNRRATRAFNNGSWTAWKEF